MAQEEPKIRIETREELVYLLAEASAIEHNLMCCYLYAAWSLKQGERDGLTAAQADATKRWSRAITAVAIEEMTHLALASNLLASIGAGPHLSRPNFPIPPGYHPSGVVVELAGFSRAVVDHFIFLERPEGKDLRDSSEFVPAAEYHRTLPKGRLMPSAQDYATVGHLYRGIRHGLEVLAQHLGERALFVGDPAAQLGPSDASLPGLMVVKDLASAEAAIETIIEQGEGAPGHSADSHYNRFLDVRREYDELLAADPAFAPSFPVAHNPTMRPPLDPHNRVHIDSPEAAGVLDFANSLYGHMLRCLVQAYGRASEDADGKRLFVNTAIDLMEHLAPVGRHLASLPANRLHPGVNAGVTFTTLGAMARLPVGPGEKRAMAERIAEIASTPAACSRRVTSSPERRRCSMRSSLASASRISRLSAKPIPCRRRPGRTTCRPARAPLKLSAGARSISSMTGYDAFMRASASSARPRCSRPTRPASGFSPMRSRPRRWSASRTTARPVPLHIAVRTACHRKRRRL